MKILNILPFMAPVILGVSCASTFADEQKSTVPETIISVDDKQELAWSSGPYIELRPKVAVVKPQSNYRFKMSKHLGTVESIGPAPKILNTRASWTAYSDKGSFVCAVETGRSITGCGLIPELKKQDVLQQLETGNISASLARGVSEAESSLMLKVLNDAMKGLKQGDQYKPFADGSAFPAIAEWRIAHGYFDKDEKYRDYLLMEKTVLNALAQRGDLRALAVQHLLARDPDTKNQLASLAAQYGSTNAILTMGGHILGSVNMRSLSYEQQKIYIMKTLSYYELARLRGDSYGAIEGRQSLLVAYQGVTILPEDDVAIVATAKAMYQDLVAKRKLLGLGDFDNTIPDVVKTYFELRQAKAPAEEPASNS